LDNATLSRGIGARCLSHREEAEQFYGKVKEQSLQAHVGMEASGMRAGSSVCCASLEVELEIGDAAEIWTKRVRTPKTHRQDAPHISAADYF